MVLLPYTCTYIILDYVSIGIFYADIVLTVAFLISNQAEGVRIYPIRANLINWNYYEENSIRYSIVCINDR